MTPGTVRLDSGMFEELLAVVRKLREECPWDRKQTAASTRPLVLNEAYELDEALASGDREHITEELGDYLFMGIFLADVLARESGIGLEEALGRVVAKLKRRHPHVYGDAEVGGADEVLENWERIKRTEKSREADDRSILDGLPGAMPALKQAHLVQERCARVGFDWDDPKDVLDKVVEEVEEIRSELRAGEPDRDRVAEEIGDLLFALVNMTRHLGIDAESALRDGNRKFARRFHEVERQIGRQGGTLEGSTLAEMDGIWNRVKDEGG